MCKPLLMWWRMRDSTPPQKSSLVTSIVYQIPVITETKTRQRWLTGQVNCLSSSFVQRSSNTKLFPNVSCFVKRPLDSLQWKMVKLKGISFINQLNLEIRFFIHTMKNNILSTPYMAIWLPILDNLCRLISSFSMKDAFLSSSSSNKRGETFHILSPIY